MQNNFLKNYKEQKGVSLIISFFVMLIVIAVILSITTLLYNEIKMIRNIGNSIVAFYAADSGVEKVLYYDRKMITGSETRGLCSMFEYDAIDNINKCPTTIDNSTVNPALNCDNVQVLALDGASGCENCDNCQISFDTSYGDKSYSVVAQVTPGQTEESLLVIDSLGNFKNLTRKIKLDMTETQPEDLIIIENAYVTPISSEVGTSINIVVKFRADKGISSIIAYIKTSYNQNHSEAVSVPLTLYSGSIYDGIFSKTWSGLEDAYYVDIIATDTDGNIVEELNI